MVTAGQPAEFRIVVFNEKRAVIQSEQLRFVFNTTDCPSCHMGNVTLAAHGYVGTVVSTRAGALNVSVLIVFDDGVMTELPAQLTATVIPGTFTVCVMKIRV